MARKTADRRTITDRAGATENGSPALAPRYALPEDPAAGLGPASVHVGDCRQVLPRLGLSGGVDLIFADPPFNWSRNYDRAPAGAALGVQGAARGPAAVWRDDMPEAEYLAFTYSWLSACVSSLRPGGTLWVNVPDDWAAEIVVWMKGRGLGGHGGEGVAGVAGGPPAEMIMPRGGWCVWHYRFGQNRTRDGGDAAFVNSKVHALCFVKAPLAARCWRPLRVLEPSDRATVYADPRTRSKRDGFPPGMRVPLDVWYGPGWGRVQGNNAERAAGDFAHDNQLPEAYLERVVLACSDEGGLVLDPFVGSGTTGVVARAYGRRFVGVEYSAANAASAARRIGAGMAHKGVYLNRSSATARPRGSSTIASEPLAAACT
ncbi:MAG: hypothetical protein C0513_08185 [Isosphaera sp.]|nr:hypothetical protein [Isosphaera sp.]